MAQLEVTAMWIPRTTPARIVGILALAFLAASCAREEAGPKSSIEPSELASRISSHTAPVVLDVRTPEEFASGHIPGAVNVPLNELPGRLASLDLSPSQEVVVHCQHGGRAAKAESILREKGYTDVLDLTGHMEAWRAGGYPLN
jgi:phage shock protein E